LKISVVGCGWYGKPLALKLLEAGHEVLGSTRDQDKLQNLIQLGIKALLVPERTIPDLQLLNADVVVLNIPPSGLSPDYLSGWTFQERTWIIFISSTSVLSDPQSELAKQEEWIKKSIKRWTILRFGGLVGKDRHPGKILSGRKMLSGRSLPVNLIHQDDAIGFTLEIIQKKILHESINVVSDEHHSREDFYIDYCLRNHLPLPEFDQTDSSIKEAIRNNRAKEIYNFKWPTMIGKSL
jgi:nucleoside-diphosphate-sugar epimerase